MLRVLEVKAAAGEAAVAVTDLAMKVCGGAAFRKELGIERRFRDARAARVMAPTTDALLDFVGRAINGLPLAVTAGALLLLGAVAYDPKVVTIWDGFRRWFAAHDLAFDYVLYSNYERQVEDLVAGRIDVAWNSPLAWVRDPAASTPAARALAMRDTDRDLTSVVVVRGRLAGDRPAGDLGRTAGRRPGPSTRRRRRCSRSASARRRYGRDSRAASTSASACTATTSAVSATRPGPCAAGEVDAACMIDANHLLFTQGGNPARRARPG